MYKEKKRGFPLFFDKLYNFFSKFNFCPNLDWIGFKLELHYSLLTQKTAGFDRIRDVKGAEGGANWNERREKQPNEAETLLSEVQWSTGAKRTPEQARRQQRWPVGWEVPECPNNE